MKFITINYRPKYLGVLVVTVTLSLFAVNLKPTPPNVSEEQPEIVQNIEQTEQVVQKPAIEAAKIKTHTVGEGETLSTIAEKYSIDVDTLQGANENLTTDIQKGDQLIILPGKGVLHTIDIGDTLWRLANSYGVDVAAIMASNGKTSEQISVGDKLFIPGGKKPQQSERQLARADTPVSRGISDRFLYPTAGTLTSGFGQRWGRMHSGIDIANDIGTYVKAARSGRVAHAGWYSGYGYTVIVEHEQGYSTLYGHLNEYIVKKGQYVKGGQVIAYMGNTGNSTGPHLHFEVWKNGSPINPHNVLP